MLTTNAIRPASDPYYYESIGFRAAWVSVMQVPLIVLLAGRTNIIGFLIGSSYERLNWAHRWVSRVLLVSVAVHAGFFLREWIRADFLEIELEFMPIIKYGMGAGGVLLWMNLSGLSPLRRAWYELFVVQHLVSIAVFLWLLHVHVPSYAMLYIWMAIGFVAFDRVARLVFLAARNVRLFTKQSGKGRRFGYEAEIYPMPGRVTRVVLKDVDFKWTPGQHLHLNIPRLGPWESHPFTLSTAYDSSSGTAEATLEIRAHTGFSHRLYQLAHKQAGKLDANVPKMTAFVQGPLGTLPTWNTYDTLVLISGSTGASFTTPILEFISENPGCVRAINVLLISRTAGEAACYLARLRKAVSAISEKDEGGPGLVDVKVCVCVTREFVGDDDADVAVEQQRAALPESNDEIAQAEEKQQQAHSDDEDEDEQDPHMQDMGGRCLCGCDENGCGCVCGAPAAAAASPVLQPVDASSRRMSTDEISQQKSDNVTARARSVGSSSSMSSMHNKGASGKISLLTTKRPDVSKTIRTSIESAWGESMVVVCGGRELSGKVRNCVAGLSDERAVHKGSGAQGIALWVEEFGL
jgi:NAD(P)H-flavin reductase